ncbi:MAG: hypothetical protein VKM92_03910 [Cyanobacteriota bacterium]|nr:hypothetical protein [Cyanobacteriota bacterium]
MTRPLAALLLLALATTAPAFALPLSVGVSSQLQLGWQASSRTGVRLTLFEDQGSSGINIAPADGSGVFAIYGTPFNPDATQETFDYRSTLRDTTTLSETRATSFSVLASQTTTRQATNPAPLGFFERGPSVFEQSSRQP